MEMTSPDLELMTVGQAGRVLERCGETVREYERTGRLKAVRVGGIRIFKREDVERLARELAGRRGVEAT